MKKIDNYESMSHYLQEKNIKKILLVCGKSIRFLKINQYFEDLNENLGIDVVKFQDFQPNPVYESVVSGVKVFRENKCDMIIAVGGGSAIDVAKCIKLYAYLEDGGNYFEQEVIPNNIPFLVVPTTAGTGSEATRFAVIYYMGEKMSVMDNSCIPTAVFHDSSTLETLPLYQKKATMLDAFCHAVESYWSIHSTDESKRYSKKAIRMILENIEKYLMNDKEGNQNMMMAAYFAGCAINITQTTAGHAMSYKLTSLYGISHGHAAALCVSALWSFMLAHLDKAVDKRGQEYLDKMFTELAEIMECDNSQEAAEYFKHILERLEVGSPILQNKAEYDILKKSVNLERLKNNPVALDGDAIAELYQQIVKASE